MRGWMTSSGASACARPAEDATPAWGPTTGCSAWGRRRTWRSSRPTRTNPNRTARDPTEWTDCPAPGLTLVSFHLEHPDPESLAAPLDALGAQVDVRRAAEVALVARIDGPHGVQELR